MSFVVVTSLESLVIASVACGEAHTACVTSLGDVYAWGKNNHGQLGTGDFVSSSKPKMARSLKGSFIIDVCCGREHCLALSRKGELFSWGSGLSGQLGKDQTSSCFPLAIDALVGVPIHKCATGDSHSICVSVSGSVFCWGSNQFGQLGLGSQGQLGHGHRENEVIPRVVEQLRGDIVVALGSGRSHTVCARVRENSTCMEFMSWGANSCAQLGTGDFVIKENPCQIQSLRGIMKTASNISCGTEHTFIVGNAETLNEMHLRPISQPFIDLAAISRLSESGKPIADLCQAVTDIFSSASSLNASFLTGDHYETGLMHSGIDIISLQKAYSLLSEEPLVKKCLLSAMKVLTTSTAITHPPHTTTPDALRVYLILFENPLMHELDTNPEEIRPLLDRLCRGISGLHTDMRIVLRNWWSQYPPENFSRLVKLLVNLLQIQTTADQHWNTLRVLEELYIANETSHIISYKQFYSLHVSTIDIPQAYHSWLTSKSVFSFLNYPFILDATVKSTFFYFESAMKQVGQPFFTLAVNRSNLLQDTLVQLKELLKPENKHTLRKPMKVAFVGEQGLDEGGVAKEFFQLVCRTLFDVNFGMFVPSEPRTHLWFHHASLESFDEYRLIGVIMGLAAFNRIVINVRFPLLIYKMLKGEPPTLDLMEEIYPTVVRSLRAMLKYDGDNFKETFGLTFEVSLIRYGKETKFNLKENGDLIFVTEDNRKEYVALYVDFMCRKSIQQQFKAFSEGFAAVCGSNDSFCGPALSLFRAEELETLVCGEISDDVDLLLLRQKVTYDGGYSESHKLIQWLWEILSELPTDLRRKFLAFTTGSDRVPIGGLQSMELVIQREGPDTNSLPTARTCFNYLLIPEYSSKEKLRERLLLAISNCEGFGLF
ncbi:E3 ubiquitin-protein ligase HERC4 [Pelomyxa schiedti]|nr:E3 ubiquitin-protein ligase HERC4 [Pelomyxa schiedti]